TAGAHVAHVRDHYPAQLIAANDIPDDAPGCWHHFLWSIACRVQISPPQVPQPAKQEEGGHQGKREYRYQEAGYRATGQRPVIASVIERDRTTRKNRVNGPGQ